MQFNDSKADPNCLGKHPKEKEKINLHSEMAHGRGPLKKSDGYRDTQRSPADNN